MFPKVEKKEEERQEEEKEEDEEEEEKDEEGEEEEKRNTRKTPTTDNVDPINLHPTDAYRHLASLVLVIAPWLPCLPRQHAVTVQPAGCGGC